MWNSLCWDSFSQIQQKIHSFLTESAFLFWPIFIQTKFFPADGDPFEQLVIKNENNTALNKPTYYRPCSTREKRLLSRCFNAPSPARLEFPFSR